MKENYIDALSIVIPTYNRFDELKRLLQSIFKEDLSSVYEIVIVNNCSDYSIEEITKDFSSDKIRIQNNPFNVRMATNMMNTFFYCKTKWMWFISDDDVIKRGSIDTIIQDIEDDNNTKTILYKYSTDGTGLVGKEKNKRVHSLEEFIDYYHNDKIIRRGNLVFGSNNVFNLKNLYPFLGRGFEFSYTYIPFLIPVIFGLNNHLEVQFSEKTIIKYEHPGDKFWSMKTVGLGLSTITHIPLTISRKYERKFYKVFMPITYGTMFLSLVRANEPDTLKYYRIFYHSIYKNYLSFYQKITFQLYCILLFFPNLSLITLNFLIKLKKNVKNKFKKV